MPTGSPKRFASNKQVLKNTLWLYLRQLLIMAVTLYTSRVILRVLGVQDYGIYTVVCGCVSLLHIVTGALTLSISRFIVCELGKGSSILSLRGVFTASLIIELFLGILSVLILLTVGLWFVDHKLVIPADRLRAADYILLFSSLQFFAGLLNVPFRSLIIAHEHMRYYAYSGMLDAVLRLAVVFILQASFSSDNLIAYGFLLLVATLAIRMMDLLYCYFRFDECRLSFRFRRSILAKMFSFAGWAFLGNGSFVVKDQGSNILLNLFFGSAVNAAVGMAMQVRTAMLSFISNFMMAVRPQIMKCYSSGQLDDMHTLVQNAAKLSYYLLLIISLPFIMNIDYVLKLWLVKPPDHTASFLILMTVFSLIDTIGQPIMTGLLAEGRIRNYEIWLLVLNLMILPISYMFLTWGAPPECTFAIAIVIGICVNIMRMKLSVRAFGLDIKAFVRQVILPAVGVTVLAFLLTGPFISFSKNSFAVCVSYGFYIFAETAVIIFFLGLTRRERAMLINIVKEKFCRS